MRLRTISATALILAAGITQAAGPYDTISARAAADILPDNLVSGDDYRVLDNVSWNDGLHEFTVETEFGSFSVLGEPMLRVRLQEVDAWVAMEETSALEQTVGSAGRQALRSVGALANAFMHPVQTVTGVPKGIGRMSGKTTHSAGNVARFVTDEKREHTSGKVPKDATNNAVARLGGKLVGVNTSYRRLARRYGVNPYTTNEAIQEELLRLAEIDAPVAVGTKILMPGLGAVGMVAQVSRAIYEESWYEIVARNEKALVEMGASPDQIRTLFNNDSINLTLMALMIATLHEWESVEGRLNVVDQLLLLETDAEAVFFAESLVIADWYHENEAPIAEMLPGTLIPVALTESDKVVAFSALDYAYWTPEQETIVREFASEYESYSDDREAWLVDQVTPRFREAVAELGWTIRSDMRGTVLPEIP